MVLISSYFAVPNPPPREVPKDGPVRHLRKVFQLPVQGPAVPLRQECRLHGGEGQATTLQESLFANENRS